MCQKIAANLKVGGRFITLNNNPELPAESYALTEKYGVSARMNTPLTEGTPITLTVTSPSGDEKISFDIYHLSRATYEWALQSAGFKEIRWHYLEVSPEGIQEFGFEFWHDCINYPIIVGIECLK